MGGVVDGPGIGRRAGARGEAGNDGVMRGAGEGRLQRDGVGGVAEVQGHAGQVGPLAGADQGSDGVAPCQQGRSGGAADGAGGAEQEDAPWRGAG